jgi:ABC-type sugar transport system substrate-binding protein
MGFPIQPESLVPVTQRALAAGIPIVSYATNWDGAVPGLVVDNTHDGRVLAEAACRWIKENTPAGEKRKVAIMGDGSVELGYQRIAGINEGLAANCSDSVQTFELTDSFTRETGNANTKAQLQAHPDTSVWLTASDDLAKGAYQALVDSGVAEDDPNVFISALDATAETVEIVAKDGIFRSAFIVTAQEVAEVNMTAMLQASRGEEVEPKVLQFAPVTAENAADYLK